MPLKLLAEIEDLRGYFETIGGNVYALNGVTLEIEEGKVTGLVGETGSGKTMTALSIPRLLPPNFRVTAGRVLFRGEDVLQYSEAELEAFRGKKVSVSFQDPKAALNPVFTVGEQLSRVLRRHTGIGREEGKRRVMETLDRVQIADPGRTARRYAHELSGGMAQRVMIALAIIYRPELLILDEPTTGLDVSVQADIISLLRGLVDEMGLTVLLITHDLGVVGELCDNVAVMYAGWVMEFGDIEQVFERPCNPYARELLRATLSVEGGVGDLYSIRGAVPDLRALPAGCLFRSRCPEASAECLAEPNAYMVEPGHRSKCHFAYRWTDIPGPLESQRKAGTQRRSSW